MLAQKQIIENLTNGIIIIEETLCDNSKQYDINIHTRYGKMITIECNSREHAEDVAQRLENTIAIY